MELAQIGEFFRAVVDNEFLLVAFITFFICEALFAVFPIHKSRFKRLTSVVVGGILGCMVIHNDQIILSVLHGILAGGATTILVAKFEKPLK